MLLYYLLILDDLGSYFAIDAFTRLLAQGVGFAEVAPFRHGLEFMAAKVHKNHEFYAGWIKIHDHSPPLQMKGLCEVTFLIVL